MEVITDTQIFMEKYDCLTKSTKISEDVIMLLSKPTNERKENEIGYEQK
jgi:hypothetical protein